MTEHPVTTTGLQNARPDREATTGARGPRRKGRRGEQPMVPDARFTSYYGKPVINKPVWEAPDIAGYLFLGGLAGASSVLAAGAQLTGRHRLERALKLGALGSVSLSAAALVHDLGQPSRFANMLRTFKPTSPMSVGSWLLSAYGPAAGAAALSDVTGYLPRLGAAATAGAAALGPLVAGYTAALVSDTAVPAWHEGYHEMPFVFVGSAATAAAGLGMLAAPPGEAGPARAAAAFGAALEVGAATRMEHRIGLVAEPYKSGRAGLLMRVGEALTAAGVGGALLLGRRSRTAARLSGAALLAASACTRFGIFFAGIQSAEDPKYTVVPQRRRLQAQGGPTTA